MKKYLKSIFALLAAAALVLPIFAGCNGGGKEPDPVDPDTPDPPPVVDPVDYAGELKLDFESETKKQEVKVRNFIDGDTTHFDPVTDSDLTEYNSADFAGTDGFIKARYIAVDTPESTGDIEKWGKTASKFTRGKLEKAVKIVVESDDGRWNIDSTGERYVLWIWYIPEGETEFRNLNVEILQNGLAFASSTAQNRYGETAFAALNQARDQQLCIYSPQGTVDENFFEGDALPVDLKQLRFRVDNYVDKKVSVDGVVVALLADGAFQTAYIEDYVEADGVAYGMAVFLGTSTSALSKVFTVGNTVHVIGTVTYYETGDTYQISGVHANAIRPRDDDSVITGTGEVHFQELTANQISQDKLTMEFTVKGEGGEETLEDVTINFGEAVMGSSVSMTNLKVVSAYTTPKGDNTGAISLTCEQKNADGTTTRIVVRTLPLYENGELIPQSRYEGKTINVKGIIDKYEGVYQVKVNLSANITIVD